MIETATSKHLTYQEAVNKALTRAAQRKAVLEVRSEPHCRAAETKRANQRERVLSKCAALRGEGWTD